MTRTFSESLLSHRWLVGDVTVLLEAGLALLLLCWHVVRDVRVVALLRKPGGYFESDNLESDNLESDGDGQADGNGSILEMIFLSPVLTSHPVLPDCLFNLLRNFA